MVAASVLYDFAASLAPTSVSAGFSASPVERSGSATVARSGSVLRVTPRATYDDSSINGAEFTITPDDPTQAWVPTSFSLRARRIHTSTSQGFKVTSSADGHASALHTVNGLPSSYTAYDIDLSSIGEITGPLTIRLEMWAGSTSAYLDLDDFLVDFDYTPAGASDQDLAPVGLASTAALGAPVVLVGPRAVVVGIVSGEAFGVPDVSSYLPPTLVLLPGGIESGAAVGVPVVGVRTAGAVAYPTGADVAAFLGVDGLEDLARSHVRVITEFARVYTRGNGFYPDGVAEPVADVILAATARLVSNPEQLDIQVGSTRRASFFQGWTLAEQRVLNDHRKVAA